MSCTNLDALLNSLNILHAMPENERGTEWNELNTKVVRDLKECKFNRIIKCLICGKYTCIGNKCKNSKYGDYHVGLKYELFPKLDESQEDYKTRVTKMGKTQEDIDKYVKSQTKYKI